MDTSKLIIGILIVVFFIVKTIIGDAKKEQAKKSTPHPPKRPKTEFPPFFYDDVVESEPVKPNVPPVYFQEGQSVTNQPASTQSSILESEMTDEQEQAHAERWRRAIIDSEILKTKF